MRNGEFGHLCAEYQEALDGLLAMRVREGAHLKKELLRAVARMTARLRRVKTLAPRVPKRQRAALFTALARGQVASRSA